ncbi:MAG: exodeoxyribonuclease VII small subunit [Candidatus Poribacteria bacterium]|nr:exodeoxyribonuclease VII small subunit [Candidatus Poribacteria bacterium]
MAEELSFEETLAKLEQVVTQLERGDSLTLDESLQAFEEGIRLTRICRQKLDNAELRVQQLVELDDDNLSTAPFDTEDDDT